MEECYCHKPVGSRFVSGYELAVCPDVYRDERGNYVGGCKYRKRVPVPKDKAFQFGTFIGRSFEEIYRKKEGYFTWCINEVKPTENNKDLFLFMEEKGIKKCYIPTD